MSRAGEGLPRLVPAETRLSALAAEHGGFSLITYNVLVPNGPDGWWVAKWYDAGTPEAARTWPHRQALLAAKLSGADADVVCLQETRAASLAEDFGFLMDAGYEAAIHRKYHLRPATLWRASAWGCVHTRHTDRVLGVVLRARGQPDRVLGVLNVHLTAGPDPRRRFRQVFDALEALGKDLQRLGVAPERAAVVVCGDFNAAPEGSATQHLLAGGTVDAAFREPRWPERALSSRPRRHGFSPFAEVYLQALGGAPATHIGSLAAALLEEGPRITAIEAMFDVFADGAGRMDRDAVAAWITRINRALGRGSEHRKAAAVMENTGRPWLSRADFVALYRSELADGKVRSLQHDLQVCGVLPEGERVLSAASLDRIGYTVGPLEAVAAWDPLTEAQRREMTTARVGLPNRWHPSDHLPLGAVWRWG
ncbi:MAG: endonuclease/exonuclease/phosphatase family protein [Alphaproteobacteria bacterium]|nr:endonuclease/exonuclease/phosphatase family protein [Alphaproteobacteria bacterium]